MRISVFGLGYVGAISAACLSKDGHTVVGVDNTPRKVELINSGMCPVIEAEADEIIKNSVEEGRLSATMDVAHAIGTTDVSLVCVGTPSNDNGSLDLGYVRRVSEEIGFALSNKSSYHVVVMRSTMLPGSMRDVVIPTLEEFSGKKAGVDFGVCINPEFLRESTAVYDYYHPPKTVIGEIDSRAGDVLVEMYAHLDAPLIRASIDTAEMVKYTDNVWHAVKVVFGNEIGNVCKRLNIDSHQVMDIFCQDTKLNLSPYYLKPGFAFGGSCLPKDVRALAYKGRSLDLELPLINSLLPSNSNQIEHAMRMITSNGAKRIGVLGFTFKAGTDDLRESPVVTIIERLLGKGYDLSLYDKNVHMASLTGGNKDYILNHIPHIYRLMKENVEEVVDFADTLVIGNNAPEFGSLGTETYESKHVIDLVRVGAHLRTQNTYQGLCW
ncbi:nucleotide sugar dehydrogenase [Kaarinaea lacus]